MGIGGLYGHLMGNREGYDGNFCDVISPSPTYHISAWLNRNIKGDRTMRIWQDIFVCLKTSETHNLGSFSRWIMTTRLGILGYPLKQTNTHTHTLGGYALVICQKTIENCRFDSWCTHQKWWFSIVFCMFTSSIAYVNVHPRVYPKIASHLRFFLTWTLEVGVGFGFLWTMEDHRSVCG